MLWENKHDRAEFLAAFRALGELHGRDVSKNLTRLYFDVLARFDVHAVVEALRRAALELRYFPKPVELLEFIEGKPEDTKIAAEGLAQDVLAAASQHGAYRTVQFADPVTNAVIRQFFGGWGRVCTMPVDQHKWFIRDFAARYAEYKAQGIGDVDPMRGLNGSDEVTRIGGGPEQALSGGEGSKAQMRTLMSGLMAQKTIN